MNGMERTVLVCVCNPFLLRFASIQTVWTAEETATFFDCFCIVYRLHDRHHPNLGTLKVWDLRMCFVPIRTILLIDSSYSTDHRLLDKWVWVARRWLAWPWHSRTRAKGALDAQARVLARSRISARMHSWVRIGRGPIIAPTRQWWQDRDNRQFMHLSNFLMITGEFTERREEVKDSLGIDKLPILCIFSWRVLSTCERDREQPRCKTFRKL